MRSEFCIEKIRISINFDDCSDFHNDWILFSKHNCGFFCQSWMFFNKRKPLLRHLFLKINGNQIL
jgi:hypothetical protein